MLFKNKSTGIVWEVVHPDHIKRCQKDDKYELVVNKVEKPKEEPKQVKVETKPKRKTPAKSKAKQGDK
ncbi:hypothetical protein [Sutcliffiella sp. NC1]|uniref:hypothetical protein n=1 Tax=Sutcliffiella sp. NC1 TaxID=3004096 RepID=UPI0022DD6100|nr:hypothetical protein [Sutcliffiella sp. NC1]WBL16372.1 hypothetical protein O1A01_06995 [Sutcliffiella sp. NC1]